MTVAPLPNDTYFDLDGAAAEMCRRSFYFFIQEFWDLACAEAPVWNWHIEYLASEAEKVIRALARREKKIEDLIVNVPPGSSKSTIWTIMLPAWAWTVDPSLRFLTLSYSESLATEHAVKSRDIIESDRYRSYFPNVQIKRDKNNKTNYETTKLGQRYAAGINGTITGIHAHMIIADDPLNAKQAASDAECLTANNAIDLTLSTRKVDKDITVTALIMQRLSENDCTAHLLEKKEKGKRLKHICLPAELRDGPKPAELARYYNNGLMDAIRLNESVLADARVDLGAAGYAGQFSQRPAPAAGLIWQRWFRVVPDHAWPDRKYFTQYGTDWDLAYTENDENAASAYVTAGKIGKNIYIDAVGWDWLEFPDLIHYMKRQAAPHYIEAKASGKSSKQTLVKEGIIAIEVKVLGGADKVARARMSTPVAEAGLVYIRQSIAELVYSDSKQGILNFPRGKYKDLADTIAQSLQRLHRPGGINSTTGSGDDDDYR